jgi:uncharacterized surface protein with fasciclin (FAS1) repeats
MHKLHVRALSVGLFAAVVGLAVTASPPAFAGPRAPDAKKIEKAAAGDVVDTAVADGRFKTLVTAVKAADLVATLKGAGPFTVFAPTDDAFAKIPADTLKAILADKAKLTGILTFHVVAGKLTAADVGKSRSLKTVQGQNLTVAAGKDGVTINGAKVIITDVAASNGVIHVIDTVMLPK